MLRRLVRLTIAALLLAALAAGGGLLWLRSSLPKTSGSLDVAGLSAPVGIVRDGHGVPTIVAKSETDAWFAVGFVHAQDRLWQMEAMRRYALGRLSELVGANAIGLDYNQRLLGFEELAKRQYRLVDPETRAAVDAYARGVNAFLASHAGAWPLEFAVLDATPMPWEPWHGLLWGRQMAMQLSSRWNDDWRRQRKLEQYGVPRMRDLLPGVPITGPESGLPTSPGSAAASAADTLAKGLGPHGASNAWAVSPRRSKTGGALLAGDPHLGFQLPNTWYLLRLKIGERRIEGATAPGTPFVILGRTDRLAWSFTSNEADLQDVVAVGVNDVTTHATGAILALGGGGEPFVRRMTAVGPVISGNLSEAGGLPVNARGHALQATALAEDDRTPDAFFRLNRAGNVQDALAALGSFNAPLMNAVLADADGRIALAVAGRMPVRRGTTGRFPVPSLAGAWHETFDAAGLPVLADPPEGYVANANERPAAMDALPHPIYGDWASGARRARIDALLAGTEPLDLDDMTRMQMDTVDTTWPLWRARLAGMTFDREIFRRVQEMMLAWNGRMDTERGEPLIFAAWTGAVEDRLMGDERRARGLILAPSPERFLDWVDAGSPWCENIITGRQGCDGIVQLGFTIAVGAIAKRFGDDPGAWRWGAAHAAEFNNLVLKEIPLLGRFFNRTIAAPGGDRTLNRGATRAGAEGWNGFPDVHGAMFRAVHDLGPVGGSRYSLALGQSGNPFSPHFDDLLVDWRDGRTFRIGDGPETGRLVLRPK